MTSSRKSIESSALGGYTTASRIRHPRRVHHLIKPEIEAKNIHAGSAVARLKGMSRGLRKVEDEIDRRLQSPRLRISAGSTMGKYQYRTSAMRNQGRGRPQGGRAAEAVWQRKKKKNDETSRA